MLSRILAPGAGAAYALLRIVAGLLFSFHGLQKLFGVLSTRPVADFGTLMWFGGVIELFGGLMIAAGFLTTWAAFLCSGTMAVAYVKFHWDFQLDSKLIPAINGGELALLYSVLFLFIACRGAGPLSFDGKRAGRGRT